MSQLNVITKALAFSDVTSTSNPMLKHFDWCKNLLGISVTNPKSYPITLQAGEEFTVFDGSRELESDDTTEYILASSVSYPANKYRLSWTAGADPAFRTDRALALNTRTITVAINPNSTVIFTVSGGGNDFTSVQVGDTVFVPGLTTGDTANVFNSSNEGFWTVIGVSSNKLTLTVVRPDNNFSAYPENVVLAADAQLQAFSSDSIQVGDDIDLSAGFTSVGTYTITAVTPKWVEFDSTIPLVTEDVIPGMYGLSIYSSYVRYLRVEADQICVIKLNGDTGNTNRITPSLAADPNGIGWMDKFGVTWSLTIKNMSSVEASIQILSAE